MEQGYNLKHENYRELKIINPPEDLRLKPSKLEDSQTFPLCREGKR